MSQNIPHAFLAWTLLIIAGSMIGGALHYWGLI